MQYTPSFTREFVGKWRGINEARPGIRTEVIHLYPLDAYY